MAKTGLLIVEFTNELQLHEGLDKRAAVERAAAIRRHPGAQENTFSRSRNRHCCSTRFSGYLR